MCVVCLCSKDFESVRVFVSIFWHSLYDTDYRHHRDQLDKYGRFDGLMVLMDVSVHYRYNVLYQVRLQTVASSSGTTMGLNSSARMVHVCSRVCRTDIRTSTECLIL